MNTHSTEIDIVKFNTTTTEDVINSRLNTISDFFLIWNKVSECDIIFNYINESIQHYICNSAQRNAEKWSQQVYQCKAQVKLKL